MGWSGGGVGKELWGAESRRSDPVRSGSTKNYFPADRCRTGWRSNAAALCSSCYDVTGKRLEVREPGTHFGHHTTPQILPITAKKTIMSDVPSWDAPAEQDHGRWRSRRSRTHAWLAGGRRHGSRGTERSTRLPPRPVPPRLQHYGPWRQPCSASGLGPLGLRALLLRVRSGVARGGVRQQHHRTGQPGAAAPPPHTHTRLSGCIQSSTPSRC